MEGDYDNVASDNIHCSVFMNSTNCVLYSSRQWVEWLLEQYKL